MPLEIVDEFESDYAKSRTGLLFNLPSPDAACEQLPAGVSLCMIVKNEERFLAECLESVRHCVDEINIVDTGSTDRTVEIARSFGANVIEREWRNDFAWARNEALGMATRRWTIVLDADEELLAESAALLRALGDTPAATTAVYLQIQNAINDESGSSMMTHFLTRIFPTTPRIRYRNVIHENIALDQTTEVDAVISPIRILHKGYTQAMLADRNKEDRNRPLLERAIREAPQDAFSWFNFGVAAVAAGDGPSGIEALEKVFAFGGEPRAFWPLAYVMLGTAYADLMGEVERGIAVVDTALERWPDHPNLVFTRAYFLSLEARYDEAREWYKRANDLRRTHVRHFMVDDEITLWKAAFNLGATYLKENRPEEAIPWLEEALERKPDSALLRASTARIFERVGRYYDAERLYREGAERDGDAGFVGYINFLMQRRRFAQAFELIERRERPLVGRDLAVLLISAAVALRDERLGDPVPYAERALQASPGFGLALSFLDDWYASNGEADKREALRRAEFDAPLVDVSDYARRSHRLLEEARLEEALAAARAGIALGTRNAIVKYNGALAAARLGRDDEACAMLDGIAPHDDDGVAVTALALRVEIAVRRGDLDGALTALRRGGAIASRADQGLRNAAVSAAQALIAAGRLADAGELATTVLG